MLFRTDCKVFPPCKTISAATSEWRVHQIVCLHVLDKLCCLALVPVLLCCDIKCCPDHKLNWAPAGCLGDCKFATEWMQEQSKRVILCVHGMKTAIEDSLCMLPEGHILVRFKRKLRHLFCTADQLKHAICKGCLLWLYIANCIN